MARGKRTPNARAGYGVAKGFRREKQLSAGETKARRERLWDVLQLEPMVDHYITLSTSTRVQRLSKAMRAYVYEVVPQNRPKVEYVAELLDAVREEFNDRRLRPIGTGGLFSALREIHNNNGRNPA